jgi:hypothetical protein
VQLSRNQEADEILPQAMLSNQLEQIMPKASIAVLMMYVTSFPLITNIAANLMLC